MSYNMNGGHVVRFLGIFFGGGVSHSIGLSTDVVSCDKHVSKFAFPHAPSWPTISQKRKKNLAFLKERMFCVSGHSKFLKWEI